MKIRVYETDCVFGFDLEADSLQDAAWITRFQQNVKREIPDFSAYADKEGKFIQYVSFTRKKDGTSRISKK